MSGIYHDVTVRKWGFPKTGPPLLETNYSIRCMGPHLLLLKKNVTKDVKARNDEEPRCTDEGRSKETKGQALISAIKIFSKTFNNYSHASQTLGVRVRVWLYKTTITKHLMMSWLQYHV